MVEKWLVEVEEAMVLSIRDVIKQSVNAYSVTPRKQWVIDWPGQVAICVSCIYWTAEVTQAMNVQLGMKVSTSYSTLSTGSGSRGGTGARAAKDPTNLPAQCYVPQCDRPICCRKASDVRLSVNLQ